MRATRPLVAAVVGVALLGVVPVALGADRVSASVADEDASAAAHAPGGEEGHVHRGRAICHATDDPDDPYDRFKVGRHERDEKPWQTWLAHRDHEDDIIPPSWLEPNGRNWDARGQEIYADRCLAASAVVRPVTALSLAFEHSCALLADGTVWCWGFDDFGQLGDGGPIDPEGSSGVPVNVVEITTATTVDSGDDFSCALLANGTVRCWGMNWAGQLGDGTESLASSTPVAVVGLSSAVSISAGFSHTCAVLAEGTVWCWGVSTSEGTPGDGSTTFARTPSQVPGITTAEGVVAGAGFSCALLFDGDVYCWGVNSSGQLGDGTTAGRLTPAPVSGMANAVRVFAGYDFACAEIIDGSLRCWGSNTAGWFGTGIDNSPTPVQVAVVPNATEVSVGWFHVCASVPGMPVQCWGENFYGQLGTGAEGPLASTTPLPLPNTSDATVIAAGGMTSCVGVANLVRCWGLRAYRGPVGT